MVELTDRDEPMWDQPEVHEVYRAWRRMLDEYDGDRMAVAEAWTQTPESLARYVRPDELHQAFNFAWLLAPVVGLGVRRRRRAHPGGGRAGRRGADLGALATTTSSATPRGTAAARAAWRRARAATLMMLALPGLGLPLPGRGARRSRRSTYPRSPGRTRPGSAPASRGRDGCRVPIPWCGSRSPYGFGPGPARPGSRCRTTGRPLTVAAQRKDPDSTWSFYRAALRARRGLRDSGDAGTVEIVEGRATVLHLAGATSRWSATAARARCGCRPARSWSPAARSSGGLLPPDTAVWMR